LLILLPWAQGQPYGQENLSYRGAMWVPHEIEMGLSSPCHTQGMPASSQQADFQQPVVKA
jgi:hypothetical protein